MATSKWNRLSEHQVRPTEFLWEQRIPMGAITILEGDPGTGKSTLLADIGGRVTSGTSMPLESNQRASAGVVLLTGEESLDKVASSYFAAGGDSSRVIVLDRQSGVSLPDGLSLLKSALDDVRARLLVIDPITDFLSVNVNHDQAVRSALSPLATLATELQIAVVLVRHLNKSSRSKAVYAGGGSIAFAGLARSVLLVGANPTETDQFVLTVSKSNLAPPSSIAYSLEHSPIHNGMQVQWKGLVRTNADEILAKNDADSRTQLEEAQLALYGLLEDGPLKASTAFQLASEYGVSHSTLKRAKRILGIVTVKRGFGTDQVWWWCLPRDSDRLRGVRSRILDATCDELFGGNLLEDDVNFPELD